MSPSRTNSSSSTTSMFRMIARMVLFYASALAAITLLMDPVENVADFWEKGFGRKGFLNEHNSLLDGSLVHDDSSEHPEKYDFHIRTVD